MNCWQYRSIFVTVDNVAADAETIRDTLSGYTQRPRYPPKPMLPRIDASSDDISPE